MCLKLRFFHYADLSVASQCVDPKVTPLNLREAILILVR